MRQLSLFFLISCTGGSGSVSIGGDDDDDSTDTDVTTVVTDTDTDTETTEPETTHEIDWSVCQITVDCAYDEIWDEPKQSCEVLVTEGNGYVLYDGWAGVERRGRSSIDWAKANFGVEFWENENVVLVRPDSTWRYYDRSDVGDPNWNQVGFDDSGWEQGQAALGYGTLGQAGLSPDTQVGGQGNITSWFRQTFNVADPAALDPTHLFTRFDDSIIVYLNGTEVLRTNIDAGPVNRNTTANFTHGSEDEIVWDSAPLDQNLLVAGDNLIAVEVHQWDTSSSDMVMQLAVGTKPLTHSPGFFEMGGDQDWILGGAYVDQTFWRNVFVYDLFTDIRPGENYAPETHYCEVHLNGEYHGLYQLTEKIKRDDDRLDLALEDGDGQSFILKNDDTRHFRSTDMVYGGWQLVYPGPDDLTQQSADAIQQHLADWEDAANGGDLWSYVDFDSAVDWMIMQEFTNNGDAYYLSIHVYKDEGGKIKFIPWDMDLAFGLHCANDPYGWVLGEGGSRLLIGTMKDDPVFQQAFRDRWVSLRENEMSDANLIARLDDIATLLGTDVQDDNDRWPPWQMIGQDTWVLDFSIGCETYNWTDSDAVARQWIGERAEWMDDNINSFP